MKLRKIDAFVVMIALISSTQYPVHLEELVLASL